MKTVLKITTLALASLTFAPVQANESPEAVEAQWQELSRQAIDRFRANDNNGALKAATQALALMEQQHGSGSPALLGSLATLEAIHTNMKAAAKAAAIRKRMSSIEEELPAAATLRARLEHLDALARYYRLQRNTEKLEQTYLKILALQEQAGGPDHLDLAPTLQALGRIQLSRSAPDQAGMSIERALALRTQHQGAEHHDQVPDLRLLGRIRQQQAQHGKAEQALKRVITIEEKSHAPTHVSVVKSHVALAELYELQSQHDSAVVQLRLIINRLEKQDRQQSGLVAPLNALGRNLLASKRQELAFASFERAVAIQEAQPDTTPASLAATFHELARIGITQNRPDWSLKQADNVFAIEQKIPGRKPVISYALFKELSGLYLARKQPERAIPLLEKMQDIRDRHTAPDDEEHLKETERLADLLSKTRNTSRAETLYERLAEHDERTYLRYTSSRNLYRAVDFYQKARGLKTLRLGSRDPDVIRLEQKIKPLGELAAAESRNTIESIQNMIRSREKAGEKP